MTATLDLNRRLATALGWTNIVDVGNALLGMPPWGIPEARGQAKVPNWAGCWKDCGPLIAAHKMSSGATFSDARAICSGNDFNACGVERYADYSSEDAAVRAAIVQAVIAKLEAAK